MFDAEMLPFWRYSCAFAIRLCGSPERPHPPAVSISNVDSNKVARITLVITRALAFKSVFVCFNGNRLLEAVAIDQVVQGWTTYAEQFSRFNDISIDPVQDLDNCFTLGFVAHLAQINRLQLPQGCL